MHESTNLAVNTSKENTNGRDADQSKKQLTLIASKQTAATVNKTNPAATDPRNKSLKSHWLRPNLFLVAALIFGTVIWLTVVRPAYQTSNLSIRIIPVTSFPGHELYPALSPDGNQVAFAWDGPKDSNTDIYVKLIDAGTPLRLSTDPAADTSPAWSPDGRHIAFVRRYEENRNGIYLVPALGGSERKVAEVTPHGYGTKQFFSRHMLSWSADGKFLAIPDQSAPEEPTSIYLLSIETGEKQRSTLPPAGSIGDSGPVLSPNGKALAFIRTSGTSVEDIYYLPLDVGGEPKRLTFDGASLSSLAWTADNREIVFSSARKGIFSLWRLAVSGGPPEQLATVGLDAVQLSISRQGNRLTYSQIVSDANIWRAEIPTSGGQVGMPTMLIASTRLDAGPQYSPDGSRIAFKSDRSGNHEIWVCNSDGSNPIQVTNMNGPFTGVPRWSPDGRQVVFDSRVAGIADIFVSNVEDGRPRRLTTEAAEDIVPSWSRDGRWIYFGSNRSGEFQTWKMPAVGGEAVQVTKNRGFEAFESPDGTYLYYTKGGGTPNAFGIWRVPIEGGAETLVCDQLRAGFLHYWQVIYGGIFFATNETTPHPTIQFFDFATNRLTEVARFEKAPLIGSRGLSVSPDRRWIAYAQLDQSGADIMLIDNFR